MPLIIDEYQVSRGAASFLMSGVLITQALFVIPGGLLVAKAPLKLVFAIGCVVAAAMSLTFLADHFLVLLSLRLVHALAFVLIMPATAPLLMRWFSARELPLMNSLHMTFFILGIGIGTFAAGPLSSAIGWQSTLMVFGMAMLVVGAVWVAFGRVPPPAAEGKVRRVSIREMARSVRSKTILLLGLADGAAFAQNLALTTWLPTYYNEVFGMSLTKAGSIVGLVSIVGVFASLTGGFLSARLGVRKPFLVIPGAVVGLAGMGCFLFQNEAVIYVAIVALGIASFIYLARADDNSYGVEGHFGGTGGGGLGDYVRRGQRDCHRRPHVGRVHDGLAGVIRPRLHAVGGAFLGPAGGGADGAGDRTPRPIIPKARAIVGAGFKSLFQKSPRLCPRQNGATTGVTISKNAATYD